MEMVKKIKIYLYNYSIDPTFVFYGHLRILQISNEPHKNKYETQSFIEKEYFFLFKCKKKIETQIQMKLNRALNP